MILLDIDGTLRDERYGIPKSAIHAIKACDKAGHIVCLCTGRSSSMIQNDVLALQIENVISGGGSHIKHQDKVLKNQSFPSEQIQQLKQLLSTSDCGVAMESTTHIFMNQKACDILNDRNQRKIKGCDEKQLQAYVQNEKILYRNNFHLHQKDPIHKICLWTREEVFHQVQEILKDDMMLAQTASTKKEQYYEIILNGCGKADAIKMLCQYLGIEQKDTIAFGDGMNDADMLRYCHVGIAMKQSDERLFAYADGICEDVMEDGIYLELKRRNIIER